MAALNQTIHYCVATGNRGRIFIPGITWDGKKGFPMEIKGISNSEYAKDKSRCSVNEWCTWLFLFVIACKSKMMPIVALSVMEEELYFTVQCVQDMIHARRFLMGLGLKLKLPMIIEIDNKGCADFCNSWSTRGQSRHIKTKQYFLRELKKQGIIKTI